MNSLIISWIFYEFTFNFANSLWIYYLFRQFTIYFKNLSLNHDKLLNLVRIYLMLPKFTMNWAGVSCIYCESILYQANSLWIRSEFREYTLISLWIHSVFCKFIIFFANLILIYFLFREFITVYSLLAGSVRINLVFRV